jgi:outer membrane murein-binding lipoprotein Lpp
MLDTLKEQVTAAVLALAFSVAFWRYVLRRITQASDVIRGQEPTRKNPAGRMGLVDMLDTHGEQLGVQGQKLDSIDAKVEAVAVRVTGLEEAAGATREDIRTVADEASTAAAEARRIADALMTHKGEVTEGLHHLAGQLDEVRRKQDLLDVTQLFTAIARGDRREQPRDDEGTEGET